MLQRIRTDYPRIGAVIVADSLYSKQPFIEQLRAAPSVAGAERLPPLPERESRLAVMPASLLC